jgi:hypothetical protein
LGDGAGEAAADFGGMAVGCSAVGVGVAWRGVAWRRVASLVDGVVFACRPVRAMEEACDARGEQLQMRTVGRREREAHETTKPPVVACGWID